METWMSWPLWIGMAFCILVAVVLGLAAYGSKRWAHTTQALANGLDRARITDRPQTLSGVRYDSRELDGLPAPVQRYFRSVLKDGQRLVTAATIGLAGTFNMSATGARWRPFTSRQRVVTRRPGFLWDARVSLLPGLKVHVVDSYIAGKGLLHAAILGLFPVANTSGGGEIARGEFMRYFAEAAWYPTALLPSQGVRWAAVDDRSAYATIIDGALTLTLLFRFNDDGLIGSFRADARGATSGEDVVMLPWEGNWSNYQERSDMTVPLTGEVAWMRPEGRKPYFRGTVTSLSYEFPP